MQFIRYGDINDQTSLITVLQEIKPDYVFHLAAQSYPQTSFTAPIDTLNTNVLGTARLLESIRILKQNPIVHVCASREVFCRVPKDKVPIDEECSFHPASPYAISKTGTDLLGRYYAEAYDMTVMKTRMFTHTGPRRGDVFHESTFAKQIAMAEAGLIPPVVKVGNLDSLRTYADVRDAVRAYYICESRVKSGGKEKANDRQTGINKGKQALEGANCGSELNSGFPLNPREKGFDGLAGTGNGL
jgi:GDPmannose 4,6-dehydratase